MGEASALTEFTSRREKKDKETGNKDRQQTPSGSHVMQRPYAWNEREISRPGGLGQLLQLGGQGGFSEKVTMDSSKMRSSQPCNNLGEECFEHKKTIKLQRPSGRSKQGRAK